MRVTGFVKWFDRSKGYGFVVPDNDGPDVLLHAKRLPYGLVPFDGAEIEIEAEERTEGWYTIKVYDLERKKRRSPAEIVATHGPEFATVKWFNHSCGYGFLERNGEADIFVHATVLNGVELAPGADVVVHYGTGPKGLTATSVAYAATASGGHGMDLAA